MIKSHSALPDARKGKPSHREIYAWLLGKQGWWGKELFFFLQLTVSQLHSAETILMSKRHILGWHILFPFNFI